MTPSPLADRVVLVTGGSRGIGLACTQGFLEDGATVVSFSRSAPVSDLGDGADRFLPVTGDIANSADVDRAVNTAVQRFGRIDILVNNAGVLARGPFLEVPFDRWAEAISVNLVGLAYITRVVLPGMLDRGFGRIINIVSRSAENPHPDLTAYAASKAAVVTFTRSLATEIDDPQVQVNGLIPGMTRTAMFDELGWDDSGIPGPEAVYPHVRHLATTPSGGPHGGTFWQGVEYAMYEDFLHPAKMTRSADVPHRPGRRS